MRRGEGLGWKWEADRVLQTPSCGCGEQSHEIPHFTVIFCLKTAVIAGEGRRCERPCFIPMLLFFLENLCQGRFLGFFPRILSNSTCSLSWIPLQRSRTKQLPKRFHMGESTGYFCDYSVLVWLYLSYMKVKPSFCFLQGVLKLHSFQVELKQN